MESRTDPGGIYLHIPFCRKKCPYCDFVSIRHRKDLEDVFCKRVLKEIQRWRKCPWTRAFKSKTLYIGGGTPSTLDLANLESIVSALLDAFFADSPPIEFTVECNPESVSRDFFCILKALGANRVSIGIQDLTPKGLRALRRPHTPKQALKALEMALEAGFSNVSVDFIYGWPGQTLDDLESTLDSLEGLSVMHCSFYELTIEEGTPFHTMFKQGQLTLPDMDAVAALTDTVEERLERIGLKQYEISNFSRPAFQCLHNINYWENRPYVGIGPSACSYVPPTRWMNTRSVSQYLMDWGDKGVPCEYREELVPEKRFRETVVMGLRMNRGISIKGLEERFSIDTVDYYGKTLEELMDLGLIERSQGYLHLTKKGMRLSNQVFSRLV